LVLHSDYLTKEAIEGFGDFEIGRQVIRTLKHADDLVLMSEENTVLKGMIIVLLKLEDALKWK
jgi:hypothetical protein